MDHCASVHVTTDEQEQPLWKVVLQAFFHTMLTLTISHLLLRWLLLPATWKCHKPFLDDSVSLSMVPTILACSKTISSVVTEDQIVLIDPKNSYKGVNARCTLDTHRRWLGRISSRFKIWILLGWRVCFACIGTGFLLVACFVEDHSEPLCGGRIVDIPLAKLWQGSASFLLEFTSTFL